MSQSIKENDKKSLNDLQDRFCEEYLKDLNGTQSYLRAGYKCNEDTARSNAARLLANANIQARIAGLAKKREERTQIEADSVLREIAILAFHNIEDYCDWDEEGNLLIKPGKEIPRPLKGAIRSIKKIQKKIPVKHGEPIEINKLELKLTSKEKNLEMLMRHLGLFNDRLNLAGQHNITFIVKEPPKKKPEGT